MADLSKPSSEGLVDAQWAILMTRNQVWVDRAKAQLFCQGLLCLPLVKEVYTTLSEALLDNATKNLVIHHHFSMSLIDWVCDSGRVIDELFKIIDGLRAEVRKLKEEMGPMVVATTEAQVSEMIQRQEDLKSQLGSGSRYGCPSSQDQGGRVVFGDGLIDALSMSLLVFFR
ncbi:hypothetical protein BHE74_00046509 [Ensete ventricosum]|nr:hypothetical protein BHE74_00046509 [Ensete ventricosum]